MFSIRRSAAAAGLAAGLLAGGAAGAVLSTPGVSGAQEDTTTSVPSGEVPDRRSEIVERVDQRLRSALAPLVEDGTIDQSQADAVVEALRSAGPPEGRPGGHGPGHLRGGPGLDAAAEALGVDRDDLREQLRGGATLAEIAEQQGVEVATVVDALVAELAGHLDERVADGDITREEADEKLAEATERITERVHEGRPAGGPRGD